MLLAIALLDCHWTGPCDGPAPAPPPRAAYSVVDSAAFPRVSAREIGLLNLKTGDVAQMISATDREAAWQNTAQIFQQQQLAC